MSVDYGKVDIGDTIYHYFDSFDKDDGSSITLTGLAVTDIEIYKNGSMTQRSSDAGVTLLDTDGIDLDTRTGIHGFSIDLSDNSDSGFYEAGNWYHVIVDAVTIDTVTVRFVACSFRIGNEVALLNTDIATLSSQTSFTLTAGSADNDAYNGCTLVCRDIATQHQVCIGIISDYVGSTKTVTLREDPGIFTMAAGDQITIIPKVSVDIHAISGDSTAADNLESACDNYSAERGLAGTALPAAAADAAGGLPISDAGGLDLDAMNTNINDIETDTNALNDTKIPDTISLANINSEVDTALSDIGLDHLVAASVTGTDIVDNSIIAKLVSKEATADWDDFVNTTDSLQALRDNLALEATVAALNNLSAAEVNTEVDTALSDIGLDHLLSAAVTGTDITDNSIIAKLVSKEATADWDDFVNTTDSLQAIKDSLLTTAQVNTEVDTALSDIGLDHLLSAAVTGADVTDNSVIAKIVASGATADWDTFVNTTDSLQAIKDALLTAAAVNAEVVDCLNTDTYAEHTSVPAATATLQAKITFIYQLLRNGMDQTATTTQHYEDDGTTVFGTRTVSDNGTTFTSSEIADP